jgi:hypothetical protein
MRAGADFLGICNGMAVVVSRMDASWEISFSTLHSKQKGEYLG